MQRILVKNAQKDLEMKDQQIKDMLISTQNEAKHIKSKMQREFENQLDDEKAATQMQIDEMQNKLKKMQGKNEQLQNLIKKNKMMEQRQSQFCNAQIASLGMQFVKNVNQGKKGEVKFIQRQVDNIYQF